MHLLWKVYACVGFLLALLASCQNMQDTQDTRSPAGDVDAEQPLSITKWTRDTELFVEFAPLVAGKETPLAVHLTDLNTFQPVSADRLTTMLESQDGQKITVLAETPVVPGIYRPVITPNKPGSYRLTFQRSHPQTQKIYNTIEVGEVKVVAKEERIQGKEQEPKGRGITFLKEQQWQMDFATEKVRHKKLAVTLRLNAEVKPTAGGEVHIIAPIGGRVLAVEKGIPTPGQSVEPGEPLAMILPLPSKSRAELEYALKAARSELEAAEKELARVRDLYKDRIVPQRRLEQAQKNVAILKARLASAHSQLSLLDMNQNMNRARASRALPSTLERFILSSPMAGAVVAVNMTPGALIEAGQDLFTIIDLERVWIEGRLFEPDIPKVRDVEQARFTAPALSEPLSLFPPEIHLVTIGSVLDPTNRSLPLILEVKNPGGQLKIGMHGRLAVPTGEVVRDLAIPLGAIVDDRGMPIIFVQVGGETFERREPELGIQSNGYVQVKAGLAAGERMVTKGAYRIHLASLSSELPAHGHAH